VDLTNKNRSALAIAAECARVEHADITLLHVVERIDHFPAEKLRGFYEKLEAVARRKMSRLAAQLSKEGVKVKLVLLRGNRAHAIVTYAEMNAVDLIIVSSHPPTTANAAENWGTISYKVALLAACPVLLAK
jgi:nucleotide-binding universal stress UspA family protein